MDWSAPYLVAALSVWAAVECAYVVLMTVTGRRVRAALAESTGPAGGGPPVRAAALAPEELALLADGEQRLAEVALLRLYLEGRVKLDRDYLALVADGETAAVAGAAGQAGGTGRAEAEAGGTAGAGEAGDQPVTVRQALLRKLGKRKRTILADAVGEGKRAVYGGAEHRRLVELGLWDGAAARHARARRIAFMACVGALTASDLAVAASLAVVAAGNWASDRFAATGAAVLVFVLSVVVTGVAGRRTGGPLRPVTAGGAALLAEARERSPGTGGDSVVRYAELHAGRGGRFPWDDVHQAQDSALRYTALQGLAMLPRFRHALELGEPVTEAGVGPGAKTFETAAEIFSAVASLVTGRPG
ncbi:MAG: hypothetical protein LBI49_16195 [Nocardiopsaceae bacterium]|jgi:hypothetical protein|nr:hypothetical protein [Nocardiopsaceae bacterium]